MMKRIMKKTLQHTETVPMSMFFRFFVCTAVNGQHAQTMHYYTIHSTMNDGVESDLEKRLGSMYFFFWRMRLVGAIM